MDLEHRVQVVEQELELLKAQIQVTLLNIQEHLLNSTYPALRAEEPVKTAAPMQVIPTPATNPTPVKRIAITPELADEPPEIPTEPVYRRPAPTPQPRPQPEPQFEPQPAPQAEPVSTSQSYRAADVRTWIELDKWVDQKVKEIGIARTRELVSLYDGPERQLLMHVVNIYDPDPDKRPAPQPRYAEEPVHPSMTEQPRSVAEQWQKYANSERAKTATYRPFGEHQELALRLIADILNAGEPKVSSNGYAKH